MKYLILFIFLMYNGAYATEAWQLSETRYVGTPVRNTDGSIKRSQTVLAVFQHIHPCPSTGLTHDSCPGWSMDHVISLDCGGVDAVNNLQWLPNSIKSCSNAYCKDRWERKVYAHFPAFPGTENCINKVVP